MAGPSSGQYHTWLLSQEAANAVWQELSRMWTASPVRQQLIQQLTNVINTRHQNGLRIWHAVFIGPGLLPPEDRSLTPAAFLCQVFLFSDLISIFGTSSTCGVQRLVIADVIFRLSAFIARDPSLRPTLQQSFRDGINK